MNKGFTLVEVMIVVAIIGIITAMATFTLRKPLKTHLTEEASRLFVTIVNARTKAESYGLPVVLCFNNHNEDYSYELIVDYQNTANILEHGAVAPKCDNEFNMSKCDLYVHKHFFWKEINRQEKRVMWDYGDYTFANPKYNNIFSSGAKTNIFPSNNDCNEGYLVFTPLGTAIKSKSLSDYAFTTLQLKVVETDLNKAKYSVAITIDGTIASPKVWTINGKELIDSYDKK